MRYFKQIDIEAVIWIGVLLAPIFIDPNAGNHLNLCLFNRLGIDFCPGCGLGRSIAFLYRGDIASSFSAHPLGMAAVAMISIRIITNVKNMIARINLYRGGLYG